MENACGTLVATIRSKMFSHLKVKINTVLVYIYIYNIHILQEIRTKSPEMLLRPQVGIHFFGCPK